MKEAKTPRPRISGLAVGSIIAIVLWVGIAVYGLDQYLPFSITARERSSPSVDGTKDIKLVMNIKTLNKVNMLETGFSVTLLKENTLVSFSPATRAEESLQQKLPLEPVKDIAYHHPTQAVAYITTEGATDVVYLVSSPGALPTRLLDSYHGFRDLDEVRNAAFSKIRFSPRGSYLSVQQVIWEGCDQHVFDTRTRKKLFTDTCDALFWSEDEQYLLKATAGGLETGNQLAISTAPKIGTFLDVDWQQVEGDVGIVYDKNRRELRSGFIAADFQSPDTVILVTSSVGSAASVVKYPLKERVLKHITDFPSFGQVNMAVVGTYALVVNEKDLLLIDLIHGSNTKLSLPGTDFTLSTLELIPGNDTTVFLIQKKFNDRGKVVEQQLYALDIENLSFMRVDVPLTENTLLAEITIE